MIKARSVKTLSGGGLAISVKHYADGRFGFDWDSPEGRKKIRLSTKEDAEGRAREYLDEGKGGALDLLHVSRERFAAFLRWEAQQKPAAMIPALVDKLIASRERKGRTTATLNELRYTLNPFSDEFTGPIAELDRERVEEWLEARKVGPRRWNNMLTVISGLHRFARSHGLLPAELTPVERIERKTVAHHVETYSPGELKALLSSAPPEWVPYVALGAFCGLRPEEICSDPRGGDRKPALRWENILWEKEKIDVPAATSKVRRRRFAALTAPAVAFLKPLREKSGPVCPEMVSRHFMRRIAEEAGVTLRPNALRHSYASYRLALTQDAPSLALEMGNSPAMIFRHYLDVKHEDEAREWFGIRPQKVPKVP